MAINTLAYRTELANELDKKLTAEAATSLLLDNSMAQRFRGTKTVVLPDVDFVGLQDYDRDGGFATGGVTVNHTNYELTRDRAESFLIDREDMDEVGVSGLAGEIMGEFVRTQAAPEVDAYTLAKLAGVATSKGQTVALADGKTIADGVYDLITRAVNSVQGVIGYDSSEEIICYVNPVVWAAIQTTPELYRQINIGDFKAGGIDLKVKRIGDAIIKPVPTARMKTAYDWSKAGFTPADGAKDIGLLVLPKKSGLLVKKTEKVRTFTPEELQSHDAYKFDYRLHFDALVKKSREGTIFAYTY
jgi:hypothetical protein